MKIFGHRGIAQKGVDENSLDAIKRAVELGVDGIEFDLHRSKDGIAIVSHDKDLRRIAGDVRKVSSLTEQELRSIELRHGTTVPTLNEVTSIIPSPIEIDFEVKDENVFELLATKLKTSTGLRKRSIISSFNKQILEAAQETVPDVRRVFLVRRWMRTEPALKWFQRAELFGIGLPIRFWTKDRIELIKQYEYQVFTWEYPFMRPSRRRAEKLRKLGIDVAIVNRPEFYQ